ncbi:MAG: hypothetical protein ACFFCP_03060 [Promethearchaeota archaeon]
MRKIQTSILDMGILGVPGILIGLVFGYFFCGSERFRPIDRIGMGILSSIFLGAITTIGLMTLIPLTTLDAIFIVLSYFGGYFLGAASNWAPSPEKPPQHHIIYEPEDEDAFDREIEDALSGEHKSNKS